ncbi:MAG: hypothetical protein J0M02_16170, partial [Planctomycetes bacterium]|nr:hypothetical protein [Planctomycetota bacterium]
LRLAPATQRGPAEPAGNAAPVAVALRWELPVGRVESIHRPIAADPDEIYIVADGSLTRCNGATGAVAWSVPLRTSGLRLTQVSGDAVLVWTDATFSVHERASGRMRWSGDHGIPALLQNQWDSWTYQAVLAPSAVVRWRYREPGWTALGVGDGRQLLQGRVNGSIFGLSARGDELHLAVARGRQLFFAVVRLSDGAQLGETQAPTEVDDWPACRAMPDGDLVITSRMGAAWWRAGERKAQKAEIGLSGLHTWWKDGSRYVFVGQRDGNKNASTTLEADGRASAPQELNPPWGEIQHMLNRADRWAGDIRLRLAISRKDDDGIQGFRADGAELFWLPSGDRDRRSYAWVLPFGSGAMALVNERGGRRRAQFIELPAGKVVCESDVPATNVRGVMPQVVGGNLLLGTERGISALTTVAQAPAARPSLAAAEPLTAWRPAAPVVADGHLGEWADLARWDAPELPGTSLGLCWRDDGLGIAVRIPRGAAEIGRTLVAIDPIRDGAPPDTAPLLLDLTWNAGVSGVRILDMPVREDEERRPIQARARAEAGSLTWEAVVPWVWMFPKGERSSALYNLSIAALPADGERPLLELGGGIIGGIERSRFLRVRLVDKKEQAARK